MTEARARARSRTRTKPTAVKVAPAVSVAAGIGGPALAALASWSSLLLVVQGRVVPGWAVSAGLLVVVLGLRRWVSRAAGGPAGLSGPRAVRVRRGQRLLVAVAVLGTAWGAVDDVISGAEYHVLRPAGPDGCTAVVRETSFLVIGNGEVYAVGRTGLAVGAAGAWTVDDGYRPVEGGTYALVWGPDGGSLRVDGRTTDPVVSGGSADVDCWW
ncbi:hypothetical protein OKJ48_43390 [Streptomyces kunmingensis]|uniref:Uncharacterized protein n=1 Tax=Streptomyces kunmingensis TaxID=68225 RepID=A0ABU6CRK9_9ACTN|nr:hypothetical protein [Streptomyces kunmingensis]MEB3967035.1 hypothetical protein [Streptomyces kunmingensis]